MEGSIHGILHLSRPTATIVVRTHTDPAFQPQLALIPPSFAIETGLRASAPVAIATKGLSAVAAIEPDRFPDALAAALSDFDLVTALAVFMEMSELVECLNCLEEVLGPLERKFGEDAGLFLEFQAYAVHKRAIVNASKSCNDAELRTLLAVLLYAECRNDVLDAIQRLYPNDAPAERLAELLGRFTPGNRNAMRLLREYAKGSSIEQAGHALFPDGGASATDLDRIATEYEQIESCIELRALTR